MASQLLPHRRAVAGPATGLPATLLAAAGLLALTAGLAATGAAGATLVVDPGALTRWGLPVARLVSDLAATLTIGLLVTAAVLLPGAGRERAARTADGPVGPRRTGPLLLTGPAERASRLAGGAGAVWVVAAAVVVVLSWSQLTGLGAGDPQFTTGFGDNLVHLPALRSLLVSAVLAAVVATGATVATRHTTVGVLAALSLGALLPVALTGHSAGVVGHEMAVDSLAFHLVGITVWVGGLAALLVLRGRLGDQLAVVARRYSALALVAFVLVAGSGLVNAWVRVPAAALLSTAYGALVLVKSGLLLLLGAVGWWHRRHVLDRLATDPASARQFWQLAGAEVLVMGLASGLGVALSSSAPPLEEQVTSGGAALALTGYPLPPEPTALTWLTAWRTDLLWATVAAVLLGGYLAGVQRLVARGDRWPVGRVVAWTLGCLVLVYATSGAPGIYGRVLFSAHMLGHMTMSMLVPPLLVLGAPVTLALRTLRRRTDGSRGGREWLLLVVHSRLLTVLGHPLVAAGLFTGSLIAFYYSPLFELSLRTHTGHVLMHLHFLLVGYLFASVMIGVDPGPSRPPYPLRLVLLFATMGFHAFFGVTLVDESQLLAPEFLTALGREWGRTPLQDQQLGGAVAWGLGELPVVALAMGIAFAWARSDSRDSVRRDRQADRDGDAELAAYNERLARLAHRGDGPR